MAAAAAAGVEMLARGVGPPLRVGTHFDPFRSRQQPVAFVLVQAGVGPALRDLAEPAARVEGFELAVDQGGLGEMVRCLFGVLGPLGRIIGTSDARALAGHFTRQIVTIRSPIGPIRLVVNSGTTPSPFFAANRFTRIISVSIFRSSDAG